MTNDSDVAQNWKEEFMIRSKVTQRIHENMEEHNFQIPTIRKERKYD